MTTPDKQLIPENQRVLATELLQAWDISVRLALQTVDGKKEVTASDISVAAEHTSAANCKINKLRSLLAGNQLPRTGECE